MPHNAYAHKNSLPLLYVIQFIYPIHGHSNCYHVGCDQINPKIKKDVCV